MEARKNWFRKHKECTWAFQGRANRMTHSGHESLVLVFQCQDCGVSEHMPIHSRTETVAIGKELIRDMAWNPRGFIFGNVQFIPAVEQLAPDKAVFFIPSVMYSFDNRFGYCQWDESGNQTDGGFDPDRDDGDDTDYGIEEN